MLEDKNEAIKLHSDNLTLLPIVKIVQLCFISQKTKFEKEKSKYLDDDLLG